MAIPADILSIERPKNSFVIRTNKTEPPRYAVRSRVGCKYVHVQYVVFLYTLFYFHLIINSCCSGSCFQPGGSFFRG